MNMKHLTTRGILRVMSASAALSATQAHALTPVALTQDQSGGKTLTNVFNNADNTLQMGSALIIQGVTIMGFVVVALSLWSLKKAAQDEREKPGGAIASLVIGGLMAGVGSLMWIIKNSLI